MEHNEEKNLGKYSGF